VSVTPGTTEVRPISPVGTVPSSVWPVDTSNEPVIAGDENGAVMSLIPPPVKAGGSSEWTAQFQIPRPTSGRPKPGEMQVRATMLTKPLAGCLQAIAESVLEDAAFEMIRRVFGPCISDAEEAVYAGHQVLQGARGADERWTNDLGFIISAAKATASCAAFTPIRVAIALARVQELASTASDILSYGTLLEECGPPIAQLLGAVFGYSFDPNEIVGPSGTGTNRALVSADSLVYTVLFENDSTASAPVTDALVEVPLDPANFDLHTLKSLEVGFGSQLVDMSGTALGDTLMTSLVGRSDLVVLCVIDADSIAHRLVCRLMARNASDLGLPTFDGFLPNNDATGRGEGHVRFAISGWPGVAPGTTLSARAAITFDDNPPIATSVWTNVVDPVAPSTSLAFDEPTASGMESIHWSAADAISGVHSCYLVGLSRSGEVRTLAVADSSGRGTYQWLPDDELDGVAVAARDSAGNWSLPTPAEYVLIGGDPSNQLRAYAPVPNPASAAAAWALAIPRAGVARATIHDVAGRQVGTLLDGPVKAGRLTLHWDLRDRSGSPVRPGVYFLRVTSDGLSTHSTVVVVR
jgi:hypothetical protein